MSSAVVRIYETEKQARKAVTKLEQDGGFAKDLIRLVTPSPEGAESAETLSNLLEVGKLLRGDSKVYAEALKEGRSIVIVQPPFGQAQQAIEILDSLNPIPLVVEPKAPATTKSTSGVASAPAWDDAAPLSSVLGWKSLSQKGATPFSEFMGFKPLSAGFSWGPPYFRLLKPHNSGLSALFGLKVLKDDPAPLSSLLGLKILSDDPDLGEDSSSRLLIQANPTPFSSKLNFEVLSNNPTPLSSALGFRVLNGSR
ncbi:MAG: hypothetical protein ACM3ST_08895 [Bdellovibrio bacteriovorus]